MDEREVTRKDIDDIIPKSLENNVFVLINNVLDKNLNKSMVSFRNLYLVEMILITYLVCLVINFLNF